MLLRRHKVNRQVNVQAVKKQPDTIPVVETKVEETPKKPRSKK